MAARLILSTIAAIALLLPAQAQEPTAAAEPIHYDELGLSVELPEGGETIWPGDADFDYAEGTLFHWWREDEVIYGMLMTVDYSYAPVLPVEAAEYRDALVEELISRQPGADNTVTSTVTETADAVWQQSYLVVEDDEGGTGTTICVAPKDDLLLTVILYSLTENYELLQPEVQRRLDAIVFDEPVPLSALATTDTGLPRFGLEFSWPQSGNLLTYKDEEWGVTDFGVIEYVCYWERTDLPAYFMVWLTILKETEPAGAEQLFMEEEFLAGAATEWTEDDTIDAGGQQWLVRWFGVEDPSYPYDESVCLWTFQDGRYHFITSEVKQGMRQAALEQFQYMLSQVEYSDYDRPEFPETEALTLPDSGFSIELPGGGTSSQPGDPLWDPRETQAQYQWLHPDSPLSIFRIAATDELQELEEFSDEELLEFHEGVAEGLCAEIGVAGYENLGHINTTGIRWYGYQYDGSRYPWDGYSSVIYMAYFDRRWYILYFGYSNERAEQALKLIDSMMRTADVSPS